MVAPSKPRTEVPDGKIDAESPWTEEVTTFNRDNSIHNDERIGIPVAPANRQANHTHKGLGVVAPAAILRAACQRLMVGRLRGLNFFE